MVNINNLESKSVLNSGIQEINSNNKFQIMGVSLEGLSMTSFNEASLSMEIPLAKGKKKLHFNDKGIILDIKPHTTISLEANFDKDGSNNFGLKSLRISFSHKICIKNPVTSYTNLTKTGMMGSNLVDSVANLKVKDVCINEDGTISVDTHVVALKLLKKRFKTNIPTQIALREKFLQSINLVKSKMGPQGEQAEVNNTLDINQLLKNMGAITKKGKFKLKVKAEASKIGLKGKKIHIVGENLPLESEILGKLDISHDGNVLIKIKKGSYVNSSFGKQYIDLKAQVRNVGANTPMEFEIEGHLKGTTKAIEMNAVSQAAVKDVMPRRQLKSVNGEKTHLLEDFNTSFGADKIDLNIDLYARATFSNQNNVERAVSTMNLRANFHDPYALSKDRGIIAEGTIDTKFNIDKFDYRHGNQFADAQGTFGYTINPSAAVEEKFPGIKPYNAKYSFKIDKDQNAQVIPPKHGISNFFLSAKNLQGNYERIDPKLMHTRIHTIGSKEYFNTVKRITGARVRKTHSVKLLIDGVNSTPERLRLINNAKEFICFQTFVLKGDESGWMYAQALVDAVKRGVKVFGVTDSIGNIEGVKDLQRNNEIFQYLVDNGVNFKVYNPFLEEAFREIFAIVNENQDIFGMASPTSTKNIHETIKFFQKIMDVLDAPSTLEFNEEEKKRLARAIHKLFGGKSEVSTQSAINEIRDALNTDRLGLVAMFSLVKRIGDVSFRWHEKYLIADGREAIVGGMNIANEYLKGGNGELLNIKGKEQYAWRDTDVLIKGDSAYDVYKNFRRNWHFIGDEELPVIERQRDATGTNVAIIQHRPYEDGDHNISNFFIYNLRALKKGDKAWFETAYFLPRGALIALKDELIMAAKRGVDVRILTNSEETTDFPLIVRTSIFDMRELLEAGVRIFERNPGRMVHSKTTVIGDELTAIGSWNFDNRSDAHDSEMVGAVYDKNFNSQTSAALIRDMTEQSHEIFLDSIKTQKMDEEFSDALMLLGAELF